MIYVTDPYAKEYLYHFLWKIDHHLPSPSLRNIENTGSMNCLPKGFVGEVFIATSLYGCFLVLFTLSSLVLHSQILTNKRQSSGSFGTLIHLTLGYVLFFIVSLVCEDLYSDKLQLALTSGTQQSWIMLCIIFIHPSLYCEGKTGLKVGTHLFILNFTQYSATTVTDWILVSRNTSRAK